MPADNEKVSLKVCTSDRADSDTFERFFAGYDNAFVLPDEKEDREGLAECLALNHGDRHAELARRFGRFRELCLIAETNEGAEVGGANFIAMPAPNDPGIVTANLNYIYVAPGARKRGNLRRLTQIVFDTVGSLFEKGSGASRPLIFIEQNDPFRMSGEDYERDTRFTGLDQLDRLRIWARLGARIVDFPYVQPALSEDQEADDGLIYSVLGSTGPSLPPSILCGHLERFFGISVLKGRSLASDAAASTQLARLRSMAETGEAIRLLDPGPLLENLVGSTPAHLPRNGHSGFREAVASIACAGAPRVQDK